MSESFPLHWMQKKPWTQSRSLNRSKGEWIVSFALNAKKLWTQSRSLNRSKGEWIVSFALNAKKTLDTVTILKQKQRWVNRFFCPECKKTLDTVTFLKPWTQSRFLNKQRWVNRFFCPECKKTLDTVTFLKEKQKWANRFFCPECKKKPWRQLLCVTFLIQNNGEIEPRGLQQTTWHCLVQIALIIICFFKEGYQRTDACKPHNMKDGPPWFLINNFHWQLVVTRWIILGHGFESNRFT